MLLSHDTYVTMIVQSSVAVMTCQQVETGTPGKRSIFPTSGRGPGHTGVVKHCVVISFYFIHLFSCLLSNFIVLFDIK